MDEDDNGKFRSERVNVAPTAGACRLRYRPALVHFLVREDFLGLARLKCCYFVRSKYYVHFIYRRAHIKTFEDDMHW